MLKPFLAALWASLFPALLSAQEPGDTLHMTPLTDLSGQIHKLDHNDDRRVRVLALLSTECPVANSYLATLNDIHSELIERASPVDLFGVLADPSVSRRDAARHFEEYKTEFPVLFDASTTLAKRLGPTHTPEAFVFDREGRLVYRGAIDDAYKALGRRRLQIQHHYLRDAIKAALLGENAPISHVEPVGCFFELPPDDEAGAAITYTRDVAPIIHARCMICHREGQAVPFPLTSYGEISARARRIVRITGEGLMPPWMPGPRSAKFVREHRLSDAELDLLRRWSSSGCLEGDPEDLPPSPTFSAGWKLGPPDLLLELPEPFTVPPGDHNLIQYFVVPLDVDRDRLVAAIEILPGSARVVRQCRLFLDQDGAARKLDAATPEPGYGRSDGPGFIPHGSLGGWSMGDTPRRLPNGLGRHLPTGTDLVVEVRYHPAEKVQLDRPKIGLYFADSTSATSSRESTRMISSIWLAAKECREFPDKAVKPRFAVSKPADPQSVGYILPHEVVLVGLAPLLPPLADALSVTARFPDGTERELLSIRRRKHDWQEEYLLERPLRLPAGTRLEVTTARWDHVLHPTRPGPRLDRAGGDPGTRDAALLCCFLLTAEHEKLLTDVVAHNRAHNHGVPVERK